MVSLRSGRHAILLRLLATLNAPTSNYSVRHLFTGQQWHQDIGLYDLRNRFYSPDLGRFLQPDPIGFWGGKNLYGYCGNNPVTRWDPFGLQVGAPTTCGERDRRGEGKPYRRIRLSPEYLREFRVSAAQAGYRVVWPLWAGEPKRLHIHCVQTRRGAQGNGQRQSTSRSEAPQQNPQTVGFDIYHPKTTAEFIIAGNIIEHGDTTDTTPTIDPIDLLSGGIAALVRSSIRPVVQKSSRFLGGRPGRRGCRSHIRKSERRNRHSGYCGWSCVDAIDRKHSTVTSAKSVGIAV